jgi:hypothetical protein
MSESTRRSFLAVAGLGTAAAVAVTVAPGVSSAVPEDASTPAGANGDMAAYVYDVTKGGVALMIEGREVVVTDKVLVARLARAFAKASQS